MATITIPGMFLTGDHASRPAANAVGSGSIYSCTTHSLIYQSDGSSWSTWATLGETGAAAHIADASDAHDASAISVADSGGNFTGTDVEAVLAELQDNIDGVSGSGMPNVFIGSIPPWLAISTPTALTANRAMLYKVCPSADVTVTTAYWNCTSSAGNLDFGIYNSDFSSRLGSTGSFGSPGTGNRSQALTGSVALTAGDVFYGAMAASSTSLRVAQLTAANAVASGGWNVVGREESALPLPSSIAAVDAWEDSTVHPAFYFK